MPNNKIRLGYYAYYPTILEPAPGPWGGVEIFNDHPVCAWEKILSWFKSREVDYVVAVISPKFRDNIYHDWPFHYVCDFDEYPEARVFAPEIITRQRDITNQVVELAEQKGIDMYFTHFNFYAPRGFIEKHPRIYDKYRKTRGQGIIGHDSCNYMNTLFGNICWSETVYQDFMKYCWKEFFNAIPKAKGIMITPGEHAACCCPMCTGRSLEKGDIADAKAEMKLDFIGTFVEEMKLLGRESLVRTWYLGEKVEKLAKATVVLPKYHVFDCFDAPIDPAIEPWLNSEHTSHLMFVQNGENASQVLWFKPEYWQRIGKTLLDKKADGALIMHNIDWGMNGNINPVTNLNLEAFFHYVRNPEDNANKLWKKRTGEIFGDLISESVLKALELLSEFTMNVTKIIFLGNEGYTFGPSQPCDENFAPDPWGVLGRNWQPPDWARGDVGRLRDYWDYIGNNAFVDFGQLKSKALSEKERCPLQVMQACSEKAIEAIDILNGLKERVKNGAEGFLDGLISSAHITHEHSAMLFSLMKTALLIRAVRNPVNTGKAIELAKGAFITHTSALESLKRQIGWMNSLPHDTLDFRNWLRLRTPEPCSYQASQFTPLQWVEMENDKIREWIMEMDSNIDIASLPVVAMPSLTAKNLPPKQKNVWDN